MRFIDAAAIRQVLTFPLLVDELEAAHRRPRMRVNDEFMPMNEAHYFVRHAVDEGRILGSKLITSFPANRERGDLPTVQAVCVLFDGATGSPLAVLDGTEITGWRTAADSALASRLLSRSDSETLLVVGAGAMSSRLVAAHMAVRPSLRRVLIWNRSAAGRRRLYEHLLSQAVAVEEVDELDAAVAQADIITACTSSTEPLIKGRHLRPGTHLDLVGGFTPAMREADDEAARRSRVYVDLREAAFAGVGDILSPIANRAIGEADILADLYDLALPGAPGRRSDADITFFKNAGGGHLDMMTCKLAYDLQLRP